MEGCVMPDKEIKTVADTARYVLAAKRVTSQPQFWQSNQLGTREKPLYHSEATELFLNQEQLDNAAKDHMIKVLKTTSTRERWINKVFEHAIKTKGCEQILILGSGFDIRAHKKSSDNQRPDSPYAAVRFFEIDSAIILDEKKRIFEEKGLKKNAKYLRADYTEINFIQNLHKKGLNPELATLIIWEGNHMYLEPSQINKVFQTLNTELQQFTIAFDFFPQTVIDELQRQAEENRAETLWRTGIDDLETFAKEQGLNILEHRLIGELEKEYGVDDNPGEGALSYHICTLNNE